MKLLNIPGNIGALHSWLSIFRETIIIDTHGLIDIEQGDILVLPGGNVGGFTPDALHAVQSAISHKSPRILAICGSFQSLFSGTDENKHLRGLSLFHGTSIRLPSPRIGMHHVDSSWFSGKVYFNHCYGVQTGPDCNPSQLILDPSGFALGLQTYDVLGVQFHPELSQSNFDNVFHQWILGKLQAS